MALEAVPRINASYEIDRGINGQSLERRWPAAKELSVVTTKMNDNPQAWLADVLARIAGHPPAQRLDGLLPWNWRHQKEQVDQAA